MNRIWAGLIGFIAGVCATKGYTYVRAEQMVAEARKAEEADEAAAEGDGSGSGEAAKVRRGKTVGGRDSAARHFAQLTQTQLLIQASTLTLERDRLRAELDALERQTRVDKDREIRPYAFDKEQLRVLAKRCQLSWDMPSLGGRAELNLPDMQRLGLDENDRVHMNKVLSENDEFVTGELRKIYIEVTGDSAGSTSLSGESMWKEIEDKTPTPLKQQVFQQLSSERAGLPLPDAGAPTNSPAERMFRLLTESGDRVEKQLSSQVGNDLARKYRDLYNGFSGRFSSSYGCPRAEGTPEPLPMPEALPVAPPPPPPLPAVPEGNAP